MVLIIVFIIVLVFPFAKKPITDNQQSNTSFLTPTSVGNDQAPSNFPYIKSDFTGVEDEPIPQEVIDLDAQKKDLIGKMPLDFSAFKISFSYAEDKFMVTLREPKDQSQKEFEIWRVGKYPAIGAGQFLLK